MDVKIPRLGYVVALSPNGQKLASFRATSAVGSLSKAHRDAADVARKLAESTKRTIDLLEVHDGKMWVIRSIRPYGGH